VSISIVYQEVGFAECGKDGARRKHKQRKERALERGQMLPPEPEWLATYESWQIVCLSYYTQSLMALRQPKP
jgi:hypothetical protein